MGKLAHSLVKKLENLRANAGYTDYWYECKLYQS